MGADATQIQTPRHKVIKWAVAGRSSTDATQSGTFGERKDSTLIYTPVVRSSAEGREIVDAYNAKLTLELYQTDFTNFYNYYLLMFAPHQLFIEEANGNWWNFVQNTGSFGDYSTVNGAELMAAEMTFEATDKEQSFKLDYSTKLHPFERKWQVNNQSAMSLGGSSGTTVPTLISTGYDLTKVASPGIKQISWGSYVIPPNCITAPKISIKFEKMEENMLMQPITRYAMVDIEYNMLSTLAANLLQIESIRNTDFTMTAELWNGLQIITTSSSSISDELNLGDGKTFTKIKHKGKIPYDVPGTQSNIIWTPGTGTGGAINLNLIGYAA